MADGPGGPEVGRISIRVVPDTSKFRRELSAQLKAIEQEMRLTIEANVDLDTSGAKAHMRALLMELQAQASAARINVNVGVDRNIIKNGLEGELSKLSNGFTSASSGAESAGQSFLGLSRMGWLVTAVFAAAAPAVGLIAGLLAGLPSLVSALLLPIGAVALGMDGIKKAAEAAGFLGEGKKGKTTIGSQLADLKTAVSSVFQQGLTPVFQQLLGLMPTLQTGFVGVAQSLVGMAQGLTNVVTSAAGMAQIQTLFANVAGFLQQMTPVLTSFVQTFLTLSTEGSKSFGLLIAPLQQFAFQFEQMINKVSANGTLKNAFQGLSETLGPLLNLFTRLFEAGLTAMGQLGGPLGNLVTGLGDGIVALMPALTSLSALIGNVLGSLGEALTPAIKALTPAFTALADQLGSVISGILPTLAPMLEQVAGALGTSLLTALQQVTPMLPKLFEVFSQVAATAGPQLAALLPQIAVAFGQLAGAALQLLPAFLTLGQQLLPLMIQGMQVCLPVIIGFIQGVTGLIAIVSAAVSSIAGFTNSSTELAGQIGGALSGAFDAVVGAISGAVAAVAGWVSSFVSGAAQVVSEMAALPGKIVSALGSLGGLLVAAGKAAMDGLLSGIKAGAQAVYDFVSGIAGKIAALKGPLPYDRKVLTPNGQALMQGLQDGIEGGFQGVIGRAKALAGEISDAIKSGGPIQVGPIKEQLKKELAELGLEHDQLKVQLDGTTDKGQKSALRDQMKQVQTLRDQLKLQSDQLGFSDKYGESTDNNNQLLGQSLTKMTDIGKNFAMANVKQFESDIGISGNGAIPTLANIGLDWASGMLNKTLTGLVGGGGTTINVNSIDEGLAAKQNLANKQALQFTQRST